MHTRRVAPQAGLAVAAAPCSLVAAPVPSAHAAAGVFVYTAQSGQQSIPFPEEDTCYAIPGGKAGTNLSVGDAYLYTDAECTIGKDAGNIGPFDTSEVAFEGVLLRTSGT